MIFQKLVLEGEPSLLLVEDGTGYFQLTFDIKNAGGSDFYQCLRGITSNLNEIEKNDIIKSIIRAEYSESDEVALINNILNDPDDEIRRAEYQEYQEYRNYAKEESSRVMEGVTG
jgi:hypothetical protein